MQFSPTFYHFIHLRSKDSPQHPVLEQPSLCSSMSASFTPPQNHRQNYSFVYSDFYMFWQQTRRQTVASVARIQWLDINDSNGWYKRHCSSTSTDPKNITPPYMSWQNGTLYSRPILQDAAPLTEIQKK
jgi:hypothetical protein